MAIAQFHLGFGLKLVDSKTETRVSVLQTIIRYSATLFSIISIFFIFTPFVNKEKKTFQDIVSNTKIIIKLHHQKVLQY